jgi:ATP-binding protein involved in chromosome partitioning
MGLMPTRDQVIEALRDVIDPELRKDIVTLEMVRSIEVHPNGVVDVTVSLTTPGCPIRDHFQSSVEEAVRKLEGVIGVNISFDVLSDSEKEALRG